MNNTPKNKYEELLQDIYSNVKMGSDSIINLLPKFNDDDMKMFMDPLLIHSLDLNGKIDHITSDLYSFALTYTLQGTP